LETLRARKGTKGKREGRKRKERGREKSGKKREKRDRNGIGLRPHKALIRPWIWHCLVPIGCQ